MKLIPESTLRAEAEVSYQETLKKSQVDRFSSDAQAVKRVGKRIQTAVESYFGQSRAGKEFLKDYKWEFNLIKDAQVNAWAMPGGKVAFYTGIMKICQDDEGIAVVMGHEIAHALMGHGNERATSLLIQNFGLMALDELYLKQKVEGRKRNLIIAGLMGGTTLGIQLPFSRFQETEADEIGLILMAYAGYNPEAAPKFWERMKKASGSSTPEFLSTHPSSEKRIQNLTSKLPEALRVYKKNL